MSGPYVLLQFGADPFNLKFEDLEGRPAFTVKEVEENPNLVVQISREADWRQQHPDIMGPNNSYLYFGPSKSPGYLVYGNGPTQSMMGTIKQKKEGSTSRYFPAQNGKEFKWRVMPQKMECMEGRNIIAVWELSQPEDIFTARLTIRHPGLATVTELFTALSLNRMAQALNWNQ
ncbi:hypothetical protein SERLA73DRAFT_177918 [Serpula lacrymans var. lacrymans S7.3]|uniref:Uncharacterized protein n=2 Tax=Serpula lacrymans var. lacrymans TaxID=341189 RepID=F8PPY1_SERL3|nr:uncharacterized protein SERLADRAFT_461770 [Serpula lacrymans var. lacrymans S7.9]EGO02135.1 hypothetical protein SERLA73DRAFT_177918 [Serpula lacrymans var. lacrymans S7.3]EGO27759.1 hypothetical protein SERLADRAFT_461770 [Serpula lacrymans var. lacrymans S7.9]